MGRVTESQLILPSLHIISNIVDKKISTTDLILQLRRLLSPGIEDTEILKGRKDDKFSQKVRNLRAHRTLEKEGYTQYIDGFFKITEEGEIFLNENQEQLRLIIEEERFFDVIDSTSSEYYNSFLNSISNINYLLNIEVGDSANYYFNLLFVSIITAMETYLYDALKFHIFNDSTDIYMQKFIEIFDKYKDETYVYCDLYKEYSEKENKVKNEIDKLGYHRISDIEKIYKGVFDFNFTDYKYLEKKIFIRHDIVHKGGKKSNGELHLISREQLLELSTNTKIFIDDIESRFREITS